MKKLVLLAVLAIDRVGPAAVRACASGVEVRVGAPDEATARRIRDELHSLSAGMVRPLIAPWSAAWRELPAVDRERMSKARRILPRLYEMSSAAWMLPPGRTR